MFEALLKKIASVLDKNKIPYMIIGGQAVLLYGEPRLTRDIDVTLGASLEKLDNVLTLVRDIDLTPLVNPKEFTRQTMVLPCQDPNSQIRVDFIFSFSPYDQQALKRVRSVDMGGTAVKFASLEDLIIHKVVAGRPRDLEDVKNIAIKNPQMDQIYIRHWLEDFSTALEEPLEQRFEEVLKKLS